MRIRSYGRLADVLGQEIDIDVPGSCSAGELRALLATEYPGAADAVSNRRVLICVEDAIVPDTHQLSPDGEVELLAPVSGG